MYVKILIVAVCQLFKSYKTSVKKLLFRMKVQSPPSSQHKRAMYNKSIDFHIEKTSSHQFKIDTWQLLIPYYMETVRAAFNDLKVSKRNTKMMCIRFCFVNIFSEEY